MSAKPSIAMTPEELREFVRALPWVVVCVPDAKGKLVARAARHRLEDGALRLDLRGPAADLPAGPGACAIGDTNLEYKGIKGAMLRGPLEIHTEGRARLAIEHSSGFDFAKIPPTRGT